MNAELGQALGWTFIHSLWQGCLLMILFMIVTKVFKFNSLGKYWGSLMMMTMLFFASSFTLTQYLSASEIITQLTEASTFVVNTIQPIQNFEGNSLFQPYLSAIASLWLLGAIFYAIRLCGGFVQIYRLKRTAVSGVSEELRNRFNQLLLKTKIDKTVLLLQSAKVNLPMVLGYFKPVILLPVGMISGLTTAQLEAILLHELSHIKRHDFLINIIQSIIEVIFYYHPVVWWLSSQARKEREHCCDDQIIAYGVNKITYANALTNVQHINFTQNKLTMGLANNKNDLLNRIKRLVEGKDQSSTNFYSKGIPLIVLVTLLMGFSWYQREQLPKEFYKNESLTEFTPPSPIREVPMFRAPPNDTIIIDELQPSKSRSSTKTTTIWINGEVKVHEVIQDSYVDDDTDWVDLDDLADLDIDIGSISQIIEDIEPVFDLDIDNDFDFQMDNLPHIDRDNVMMVEEELAIAKETLNRVLEELEFSQEDLSQEQKESMKEKMHEMEYNMQSQIRELNNFHYKDRKERDRREERDELRSLREKERSMQRREFELQRKEFSTQHIEQKMQEAEKQLSKREEEMREREKEYAIYQKELVKQLRADGYLKKRENFDKLEMSDDGIKVNGKSINAKDLDKYLKLKNKYLE